MSGSTEGGELWALTASGCSVPAACSIKSLGGLQWHCAQSAWAERYAALSCTCITSEGRIVVVGYGVADLLCTGVPAGRYVHPGQPFFCCSTSKRVTQCLCACISGNLVVCIMVVLCGCLFDYISGCVCSSLLRYRCIPVHVCDCVIGSFCSCKLLFLLGMVSRTLHPMHILHADVANGVLVCWAVQAPRSSYPLVVS